MKEKVVKKLNENGNRKVVIVKQEDGAGLHQNKTYLKEMKEIFDKEGWIFFNQPSQSPITNVHDACIFPMMSKEVSKVQALEYGNIMLKGDELYHAVSKVWKNPKNCVAMSRAFAGHHQIVCSILEHEGDNTYLSSKGGLSFGIRKMFVPDQEGYGVIPISLAANLEGETLQGAFLSERAIRKLKYDPPNISTLHLAKLKPPMIFRLNNLMDKTQLSDSDLSHWEELYKEVSYLEETDTEDETEGNDDSTCSTVSNNDLSCDFDCDETMTEAEAESEVEDCDVDILVDPVGI